MAENTKKESCLQRDNAEHEEYAEASRSLDVFMEHYQNWCKRKDYNFSDQKAEKIGLIPPSGA